MSRFNRSPRWTGRPWARRASSAGPRSTAWGRGAMRAWGGGEDNIICAQTGLAGNSILGKNVLLAGQVGISGHLTIHDNAVIYAQSGIGGDVKEGAVMSGSPAFEARDWLRAITAFQKLPELLKTVRKLEKRLEKLQEVKEPSHQ